MNLSGASLVSLALLGFVASGCAVRSTSAGNMSASERACGRARIESGTLRATQSYQDSRTDHIASRVLFDVAAAEDIRAQGSVREQAIAMDRRSRESRERVHIREIGSGEFCRIAMKHERERPMRIMEPELRFD